MLSSPEAQKDPHYWISVFAGHCVVGLILWVILGKVLLVALIYALCWEAVQYLRYGADPWDCLLDWIAVVLGAIGTKALWANDGPLLTGCIATGLAVAAGGYIKRKRALI